jgi:hypothetical protein
MDIYSAGAVMADLLFGKAPYFKTRKGKIEW